jgi:hypothetical protein
MTEKNMSDKFGQKAGFESSVAGRRDFDVKSGKFRQMRDGWHLCILAL